MGQGFTPEFMEELKYKCDIVEIISQYVPLQKKGGRYFGCCPFHNEKTPSFCVNQSSGFYHCFGCGASGDVVKFIMEIESLSFVDAVKYLADKVGLPLPELKFDPHYTEKKEYKEVLKQLMKDAARHYRNNLLDEDKGKAAREYLMGRGINDDVAKMYGMGLALDADVLPGYLRRKGYKLDDLKACGIIASTTNPQDAFAHRIIVPIINGMNEVVAFGGRIYRPEELKRDNIGKYINSTNTQLFDKGRIVYGVNFIKHDRDLKALAQRELLLVEGYMDVISLGAVGIRNAVAGMGTALADGQIRELKRITDRVYVCYDGDRAGRNATVKNIDAIAASGVEVMVVSLEDGKDPDETVREKGKEGFSERVAAALPILEYKLKLCEDAYDLNTVDGRAKYVKAAGKVLKTIDDPAEREVYCSIVSKNSGVSKETIYAQTEQLQTVTPIKHDEPAKKADKYLRAARFALNRIMTDAPYVDLDVISEHWFAEDVHREIVKYAKTRPKGNFNVGIMYDDISSEEVDKILDAETELADEQQDKLHYEACLTILANAYLDAKLEELKKKYASIGDPAQRRDILLKITEIQKKYKSVQLSDKLLSEEEKWTEINY